MFQAVLPAHAPGNQHATLGEPAPGLAGPNNPTKPTNGSALSAPVPPVPVPTTAQLARLHKLRPETREAIRKRVRELQARIPTKQLTYQQLWRQYLEAADQIIEEIPGRINPLLPPEKILLFLVDLQNQLQN